MQIFLPFALWDTGQGSFTTYPSSLSANWDIVVIWFGELDSVATDERVVSLLINALMLVDIDTYFPKSSLVIGQWVCLMDNFDFSAEKFCLEFYFPLSAK